MLFVYCAKLVPDPTYYVGDPNFKLKSSSATVPKLIDYGGPVLSNVHVVPIYYGTVTSANDLTQFYGAITNSVYMDWLSEYNRQSVTIGRGTAGTPLFVNASTKTTLLDPSDITPILTTLFDAGKITPNANTYYPIHFQPGISIKNSDGSQSCVNGGFCAYHSTIKYKGTNIDLGPGSGCYSGCGGGTQFENTCSVASHELIESVTDAHIGFATSYAPPLAWYDADWGNALQGKVVGGDGKTYVVQKQYSNALQQCIYLQYLYQVNQYSQVHIYSQEYI
ncbi:hypothetical protein EDD86DRAFT_266187 [Gorgonomyces haynaldii]|nr:hypothetical protein EDD86DRAFT_266187 [Gorgonomyces haynaldii]